MTPKGWGSSIRDAVRGVSHSALMSLASVATVAVSLLVLSVVVLVALNLGFAADNVEGQVEIKAFLCSSTDEKAPCEQRELTEEEKQSLVAQLRKRPDVKEVTYISKEQAFETMKQEHQEWADVMEELDGDNPLRDSVEIRATDASLVETIAQEVKAAEGVGKVEYGQDVLDKLLAVTHAVRYGGGALVILLLAATVLTISNTIRLSVYARRREIAIMKLVGATDGFIRRPFVLEGILLGIVGAAIAALFVGLGYTRITAYAYLNIPFLPMVKPDLVITDMALGLMVLGGGIGAMGSLVSIRKFLKV